MRKLTVTLTIFLLVFSCIAQDRRERINPTPDPSAPFRVYIPRDLEDCFAELTRMLHPSLIAEMRAASEQNMIAYHDNLGRWIRNNWGLWAGSRLSQYFNRLGINHPDDMSGIILDSFWRHLRSEPIRLEEQVEHYREYWRRLSEREAAITPVSETAMNTPLRTYNGETIRLSDYRSRVVVLSWLDTSCNFTDRGCRMVTQLVRLKNDYGSRGVEVIGLVSTYPGSNSRRAVRLLRRFITDRQINFPVVWSDDRFSYDVSSYNEFGYMVFPQVFVISPDGHIIKRIRGFDPQTAPAQLREAVERAITGAPAR